MPPIRILHLITGLGLGGAETWLSRLLSRLDQPLPQPLPQSLPPASSSAATSPAPSPSTPPTVAPTVAPTARFDCRVVSLLPLSGEHGALAERIRALGVPVQSLNMGRGLGGALHLGGLAGAARLVGLLRQWRPQVVQTWLYHADLLGLFATRASGCGAAVSWGLRSGYMDFSRYGLGTRLTVRACAALSPWPEAVTANSRSGAELHVSRLGYRPRRLAVLENGVDGDVFRPDSQARAELRAQWGAAEGELLIGLAARLDPMKGHDVFCAAISLVRQRFPQVRPVFCGQGTQPGDVRTSDAGTGSSNRGDVLTGGSKPVGAQSCDTETGSSTPDSAQSARSERAKSQRAMSQQARSECGGPQASCSEFDALLERHGLAAAALRLGRRDDMPRVLAALDVLALPSLGEGFPNVVAEALCCGTPVASLDVGDARAIVGPGGMLPKAGPEAGPVDASGQGPNGLQPEKAPGGGAGGGGNLGPGGLLPNSAPASATGAAAGAETREVAAAADEIAEGVGPRVGVGGGMTGEAPGVAGGIDGAEARAQALAECLLRLLALEPAQRARMGAAGREHVLARYGLDTAVERWAAHFASLAAGR